MPVDSRPPGPEPAGSGRCRGTTKKGGQCPNLAAEGRPFCLSHDPEREDERRERMAELGRSSSEKRARKEQARRAAHAAAVVLATVEEVKSYLARAAALAEAQADVRAMIDAGQVLYKLMRAEELANAQTHAGAGPDRITFEWPDVPGEDAA